MTRMKMLCIFVSILALTICVSCDILKDHEGGDSINKVYNKALTGLSDTGVKVEIYDEIETDKQVGIFYFLWQGTGLGASYPRNYDCTEILKGIDFSSGRDQITLDEWKRAGGGNHIDFHWWGEPLFGYYDMADEWVVSRHVKMLTDAKVDFLVIDFTNIVNKEYVKRLELLFSVLDKFQKQGFNVPKVACAAYDDGPNVVDSLYSMFYASHPEYRDLFYHWNGNDKPLIFDNIRGYNKRATGYINTEEKLASYKEGVREFFDIRDLAFPHETKNDYDFGDSFLYLDFRSKPYKVIDGDGYSYSCVSVSEISVTNRASSQWFSNTGDRTRSWDGKENRNWKEGEEDAYLYGYNFAHQFDFAISENPDMIFVTGWNEWIAQLQLPGNGNAISFVDAADINNSRDIEPMKGGYGDNYYMQLCSYINTFKYGKAKSLASNHKTIDINNGLAQWDDEEIVTYKTYADDIMDRNHASAHNWSTKYVNKSGQNDFKVIKIASDKENIYFFVETHLPIINFEASNSMTLFINTGSDTSWYGNDFVVHRNGGAEMLIERSKGGWAWEELGKADYRISENMLMLSVERKLLNLQDKDFTISFKWADNYKGEGDIMSFYTDGDAAPYGRLNFSYTGKK